MSFTDLPIWLNSTTAVFMKANMEALLGAGEAGKRTAVCGAEEKARNLIDEQARP